ncbi:protein mono-ADP-ribosyltransferase PARP14-like [Dipodomys merriami]|uniref:protein mono-ADP-ribosyltransferase PARP14-like n=1 Tax=Dipodomys merriami TaxID=94247 RepID=UPI0038557768
MNLLDYSHLPSGCPQTLMKTQNRVVACGDITKEDADVIANPTSNTFNSQSSLTEPQWVYNDGGSLKCKNIIHVAGENNVKRSISCVLQEYENRNYSSIHLPAIGTGSARQDLNKVAEVIMDTIEEFGRQGSIQCEKS